MPAVVDELVTRLDLAGLGAYSSGFSQAGAVVDHFGGRLDGAAAKLAGFSAVSGGAALVGFRFFSEAAKAAGDEAAVFGTAAGNFKGAFPEDELESFSSSLQGLTGVADDQIGAFLGLLGTFKLTKDQAQGLALPILNAAEALKAQGVSTQQLAVQVGKAAQTGEVTALRRSGIIIEEAGFKSATAAQRVKILADALQNQGGAAAIAFRNTMPGALQAAANAAGDVQEAFGAPLTGAIISGANAATQLAQAFTALPEPVKATVAVVGVGIVGALGAASIATGFLAFNTLRLAEAHLKAAAAAGAQQKAEAGLTGALAAQGAAGAAAGSGGFLGRVGRGLKGAAGRIGRGGLIAGAAGIAGEVALGAVPEDSPFKGAARIGQGALAGAGVGALAGSIIPGLGTAAGGAIGGVIGGGLAAFQEDQRGKQPASGSMLDEQKRTNELLARQNEILTASADGPVSLEALPLAQQRAILQFSRMIG